MPRKKADTKKVKIEDLVEGDKIHINGRWRTFSLARESLTMEGYVNIMVKDTNERFHRVKAGDKIERKVVEA